MTAEKEPDISSTAAKPPGAPTSVLRVLFVDDEPLIAHLGEQFLKRLGYEPVVHTDPVKALDAFLDGHFDLVITDLSMPMLSGLDLGLRFLEERPGQRIILTTAYHSMLEGKDVRTLGFCDFLPKPYNLVALRNSIQRALGLPEA